MGERNDGFSRLIAEATVLPAGSDGLICLPYFAGERTPLQDPDARGMFAGLTLRHTQAHIFRAMLEGIGFGARHNLEVMGEMGATPGRLVAVGGGTKNRLWTQVVERYHRRAAGDSRAHDRRFPRRCVHGGVCQRHRQRARCARPRLGDDRRRDHAQTRPTPPIYDEMYPIYRDLYEQTKESIHRLGAIGNRVG